MDLEFLDDEFLRGFLLGILAAMSFVCVVVLVLVEGRRPPRRRRGVVKPRRGPLPPFR